MFTKKHIEHIHRIESRLQILENSAPHLFSNDFSNESERQLSKRQSLGYQQKQQQAIVTGVMTASQNISTNNHLQQQHTHHSSMASKDSNKSTLFVGNLLPPADKRNRPSLVYISIN
jgi:hypothetical protein